MKKFIFAALLAGASFSAPAYAQDEDSGPITISGSVALVSDYRFRGVSQSDEHMAVQGGLTINHESGLYAGAWMSNLSGWGTFGGSNTELDLFGGFKKDLGGVAVDVGLTWYMYPGGSDVTDFAEPYVKVSSTLGPVNALVGVAYAPKQRALGNVSNTPQSAVNDKEDNLYLWTDLSAGISGTPITVKAHLGYSNGNPGLGPNGTSLAPTGKYLDWMLGVDVAVPGTPVTVGLAYIDTDISKAESAYISGVNGGFHNQGTFNSTGQIKSIASSKFVASISAAF